MAEWEEKLQEQRQRMDEIAPPAEQIAKLKAMMRLNQLSAQAQMHGALMRMQRPQQGVEDILKYYSAMDVPSRATTIELPGIKQAYFSVMEYLARPFVHKARLTAANLARASEEKMTEPPTDDPETLSWFQPAKMLTTAKGVTEGWRGTDEAIAEARRAEMQKKVDEAKQMFEDALRTEYQGRSKYASASAFIDQLAESHVKRGFLDANSLLQMYTTAGTLAGAGARQAAKDYVKEIDPREMKVRAIKELLHQRIRQRPPTVRVEIPDPDSQDKIDAETATRG